VILLAHEPQMIDGYSQPTHPGVDLVFAGHAHGGQIRLPFTDGLFAPGQGILPKLTSGVHVLDNTTMIISRGLGNSTFPLRLFNRPEVVVTELKRKRKLSEKTEKKYDFREES
jgi:predicted MPP superfamily phosphohydrolase